MYYFEQKCLLMLINGIFKYLSTIVYIFLHTRTCRCGHESDIWGFGSIVI